MIKCMRCMAEKKETDFYPSTLKNPNVSQKWCKSCKNEYTKNYARKRLKELKILKAENYLLKMQIETLSKRGE